MKKARLDGFRKNRTKQILFGADVDQIETVHSEHELTEAVLEALEQTEPVLEALVQTETVEEAVVQT